MFGIGPMELVIIALVAVIFIGPQKLPEVMKQFGKFFVQARRYTNDIRNQVQSVVDEAENELRLEELEKLRAQVRNMSPQKLLEEAVGPLEAKASPPPAVAAPKDAPPQSPLTPEHSAAADTYLPDPPSSGHFEDPHLRGTTLEDVPKIGAEESPPEGAAPKTTPEAPKLT